MMFRLLFAGVGVTSAQYYDTAGYDSGSSYGGGGYDSSYKEDSYKDSYQATSYQGTSYGDSEVHPFVDAWFTFNLKGDDTKAFENSAARVSISKGKNDILVLDHIFEDTKAFTVANADATNVDCSTRDLTGTYSAAAATDCVHTYEIGVQLAAGTSTKKYGRNDAYSKNDPAIVAIPEYGKLPVDIPAVQMNCVEINDAPNSEGVWADFSLDSTVSLKSGYGSSYGYGSYGSSTGTVVKFSDLRASSLNKVATSLNPPIFERSNSKAIWNARGSPEVTYSGTCAVGGKTVVGGTDMAIFSGDIQHGLPCAPIFKTDSAPVPVDTLNNDIQCITGNSVNPSYCSGVRSVSGCYPGCKEGQPTFTATAIPATTDYRMGFCGYPTASKCVNKPRSLHCTAVIELGTVKSYGGGYGGY